jgi:hypothetical protein
VATRSLIHSVRPSKLAVFPKPKKTPQKRLSRRIGVLQAAMRDRLRVYRGDDPTAFEWRGWVLG